MIPARGFSIRYFLPDGTPDGMKIVEKSNCIGRAIICPRGAFQDVKQWPEFKKTGVYVLVGHASPDDLSTLYTGEGDPVPKHPLEQGLLVDSGDRWRLVEDYTFGAPSAAVVVMLARTANGRIEWKDEQCHPLKELQAAPAAATEA